MTENISRQPAGIPTGGQFATSAHAEPGITLTKPFEYDPADVAIGILEDLNKIPEQWTSQLYYGTRDALRAGTTTHEEVLDGMLANNRGGRCKRHEYNSSGTERYCNDCQVAYMVEARTNPKPDPVPRGVIPVRPEGHYLEEQHLSSHSDEEFGYSSTESKLTGDELFEAAVRRMFKAPENAKVEVIQQESESGTDSTMESSTEITVKCDGREVVYSYMGDFMKALDQAEQDPKAMALRFIHATSAERPLLNGIAAVYLYKGDYADPVPVFGQIRNVFAGGSDPSMDFLHIDGRQEYLRFDRVVAILETDQSSEYTESDDNDD